MLYHTTPHRDNDVIMPSIIRFTPRLHHLTWRGQLAMVINWTPTAGLIPCQVQPGPAYGFNTLLVDRSDRNVLMVKVDGKAIV